MPVSSNYAAFELKIENADKTYSPVAGQTVHVYDISHAMALADLATPSDANGVVPGGTLPVASGTRIRFSFWRADGECGKAEGTTT
jgi:hypothetical protein